jgi:peptide deformylase
MILPVYIYGQQILRKEAEDINNDYPDIKQLIKNMFDTMYNAEGVGLAAPQIGISIRLLVIDSEAMASAYPECKDFKRVIINPEIIEHSDESNSKDEGCLSFPGIHEKVDRYNSIKINYLNENFEEIEEVVEGFVARIVQHECEHLDGGVFIDNLSPIRRQLIKSKLNNLIKGDVSCDYKTKTLKNK